MGSEVRFVRPAPAPTISALCRRLVPSLMTGRGRQYGRAARLDSPLSRAGGRGGGRGGQEGQLPSQPRSWGGGANISFCPTPRNLEGAPRKNCVENARDSITPNIPLVETGQVRKIGVLRLSKMVPPIQVPSQIGLPTPNFVSP